MVQPERWTLVLDPEFQRYHVPEPDSTAAQLRWAVTPGESPNHDVLTWSFPEVRADGATLLFEWGPKRLALDATVTPSHPLTIARGEAEQFLGTYEWRWTDEPAAPAMRLELYYADGMIRQRHTPWPSWYPLLQNQPMVRTGSEWMIAAILENGNVWEMVADMIFEFTFAGGKAVSFEIRDDRDELMGSGKRVAP